MNQNNIIQESVSNEVLLYGKKYQVIDNNGENKLKRFDEKSKMWVTLSFAKKDDLDALKTMHEIALKIFMDANKGIMI